MPDPVTVTRWRAAAVVLALLVTGAAPSGVDYERQVKPILKARCYACHGALKQEAGLRVDTGEALRRGGDGGPAVVPEHAGESPLLERVTEADQTLRMPPEGAPLSAEQVATLRAWVNGGAISPGNEAPEADPKRHWSFAPPTRPAVPVVRDASVRDPIDAFLARDREARGLAPLPPAPPHVLLRRVYLDLTGLPPTREELQEFLADPSDLAYERVVDRLLASPRHGERWARHWMDVWRYSDWYGRRAVPDVLNSYAQVWRWRDWIVRSLNDDRGYDSMVRAMLAADEISPSDDSELVATGFLVRNWYRWNYNTWMKDNVEHVGKAFLGLTFNCAHCHDHKYDPITHNDYFALRAVFEPLELRHDRVPGEPDPGPYPKYDYGKAYKPITSGMVRVFDEKLDAKTFLYTKGESRNIVPGRPPVEPGVPRFLGGAFRVEPVAIPAEAANPALKGFVRQEERAGREGELARSEQQLAASRTAAADAAKALAQVWAAHSPNNPPAFADPLLGVPAFTGSAPAPLAEAIKKAGAVRLALAVDGARRDAARADLASFDARLAAEDARRPGTTDAALSLAAGKADRLSAAAKTAFELAKAERSAPASPKAADALKAARSAHAAAVAAVERVSPEYTPLGPVYPSRSTGRRAALARWVTGRDNPLAARVAVNHLWRRHFGKPLVESTFDFGRNGSAPTHPELLDWLAVEFMEPSTPGAAPWSFKALHRRIALSAAYRMASHTPEPHPGRSLDRENQLYWHYPPGRMEAEVVRDSFLHLAGKLDATVGGPDIDYTQGLANRRRSLYFTHHGEAKMPFLETFDAPDACDAYRRTQSVVPQQALALVNNDLLLTLCRDLSDRLWLATGREPAFVTAAFEQVLGRPPGPAERSLSEQFLARQTAALARTASAETDPAGRARRALVHALFNHTDFLTVH